MLTIKPVGSVKHFFEEDEYVIDVKNCVDVLLYIQSMHPRLALFMKQSGIFETIEDICFLDKDGKIIDPQTFPFHRFEKEDENFHNNVRSCYLEMSEKESDRWIVIDANNDVDYISNLIYSKISKYL